MCDLYERKGIYLVVIGTRCIEFLQVQCQEGPKVHSIYSPLDKHIVWKEGPATRYADKLSIVSCHNAKHEPRSARINVTRGTARERAEPLSCSKTGTPVNFKRQSLLLTLSYKLASDGQT